YTPRGLVVPLLTASTLSGPYRIANIEVSFASVYTHRVPVTPYRGAGQPQAVFVLERVMDLIARETGRDRAAVRFANFVQPADMPGQGQGREATLAQVAADELGVTPEEVSVIGGDTLGIPQGIGTFASRAAVVGGNAVALAARELRAKCVRLAAQALGIAEEEVQQHGKVFAHRGDPERSVSLGRLASAAAVAPAASGVPPGLA